jgi:hypothetical protein
VPAPRRSFKAFGRRVSWLLVAKILFSLVVIVYAATVAVTTTNYQAEMGANFTVANNLLATDKGFYLATSGSTSNSTSCSSPTTFGSTAQTANNGITSGHLVYVVRVNSTTNSPMSQKFNVTFFLGLSTFGPLCIQTPASPQNNQIIDCKFDIATNSLPVSPYSFKVTVQ